ncbi:MAG TPA: hypothetical protein VHZ24_05710 [Pirellulales bacterium]|jgi:hypothetical protein|nr:hypothetical protein [Pirellulales bacterium]
MIDPSRKPLGVLPRWVVLLGLAFTALMPSACNRTWRRVDGVGIEPQQRRVGNGALLSRLRGHNRTFQDQDSSAPQLASKPERPADPASPQVELPSTDGSASVPASFSQPDSNP